MFPIKNTFSPPTYEITGVFTGHWIGEGCEHQPTYPPVNVYIAMENLGKPPFNLKSLGNSRVNATGGSVVGRWCTFTEDGTKHKESGVQRSWEPSDQTGRKTWGINSLATEMK